MSMLRKLAEVLEKQNELLARVNNTKKAYGPVDEIRTEFENWLNSNQARIPNYKDVIRKIKNVDDQYELQRMYKDMHSKLQNNMEASKQAQVDKALIFSIKQKNSELKHLYHSVENAKQALEKKLSVGNEQDPMFQNMQAIQGKLQTILEKLSESSNILESL